MKSIKKSFAIFLFSVACLFIGFNSFSQDDPSLDEPNLKCKTEVIDCPNWGTGDRTICHQNGPGISCICGESTTCGDD